VKSVGDRYVELLLPSVPFGASGGGVGGGEVCAKESNVCRQRMLSSMIMCDLRAAKFYVTVAACRVSIPRLGRRFQVAVQPRKNKS